MEKKQLLFIPGPVAVSDKVLGAMSRPLIDHRGPEFAALASSITGRLKPIFGTERADIILLGSSGTGGLEAAIASAFSPGDRVLAAPVGVFGQRMVAIGRRFGLEVEVLESQLGARVPPQALDRALRARTFAGLFLTHNETSTGVQNDMAALAAIVREHDVLSVVDSVSGMGATRFEMDAWNYDIVVSASQKVLAAPPGVAMVAVSARGWKAIERAAAPRFYFDLIEARDFAKLGQTPWTPPVSVLFALEAALAHYQDEGASAVWERHELYARSIRAAFDALGMPPFSAADAHSVTVVASKIRAGAEPAALLRKLREERGVVLSGGQGELKGKIVRVGTMGDISQTDVLGAIGAVEMALLEFGIPVRTGSGVQAALRVFLERDEARRDGGPRAAGGRAAETAEASP